LSRARAEVDAERSSSKRSETWRRSSLISSRRSWKKDWKFCVKVAPFSEMVCVQYSGTMQTCQYVICNLYFVNLERKNTCLDKWQTLVPLNNSIKLS
jgi:hypothetical protein